MLIWTSEQELLAKTVADFARAEVAPKAAEIDDKEGVNLTALKHMGDLGLLGITADEEYGGAAMGCTEATIVMDKIGEVCASTALSYLAHSMLAVNNLNQNASPAQKKKYLPDLITGQKFGAMGMTEPDAGSDALGLRTKAVRKGDKYILNGAKTYITNGPIAETFVIYARTGTTKKEISTFIVERGFPGFRVGRKLSKMGMRGSPTSELHFENCEVPVENLVGRENDSVAHMMHNLNIERITIAGISVGIARACLDYCVRFAQERTQFGKPISQFQMIQERIAEMAANTEAATTLIYTSAMAFDRGQNDMMLGAKCKLFAAQIATKAGLDAVQILGGAGYMREYPVERYMRDAKLMEIGAGTNEVMRLIIAKALMPERGT